MSGAMDDFLAGYPPPVQAVAREICAMVRRAMPGAHEIVYATQNHIGYGASALRRDLVCYVCPVRDYVRLGFMYGSALDDPERLLVGEGARLRHIKLRSVEEARRPAVEDLVRDAWAEAAQRVAVKAGARKKA